MQVNQSHSGLTLRQQSDVTGGKGTAKIVGESRTDTKTRILNSPLAERDTGQQAPGGGLPFNNPLHDADAIKRIILAGQIGLKQEKKVVASEGQSASPQSAEDQALADITEQFQSRFKDNASDHDAFHSLMRQSFGDSYDYSKAEGIRQQTLEGDFSWMPDIQLVDGAALTDTSGQQAGAAGLGAYSEDNDTVYLSRDLLASNPGRAEEILTEEVGHALDARINVNDAAGDEGDIFSILLHGGEISSTELTELRSENDSGTIVVDGKEIEVEYGLFSKIKKAFKKVGNAIGGVLNGIKNSITNIWDTIKSSFEKLINSQLFNTLLMVAQFIPIPMVQVAVRVINIVKAAYSVYQGVKHGSIAMVAGGVAGAFGGAAKLGQACLLYTSPSPRDRG